MLTCTIEIPRPRPVKVLVNHRKLRSVNTKILASDIQNSLLVAAPKVTLDELVEQYNATLKSIVDVHAPVKTRWLTIRPHAPWNNDELRAEKREKRRKERRWRCTRLEVDKQIFQDHCSKYQDLVKRCKTNYHKDHISSCDNHMLFAEVDKLANGRSGSTLPAFSSAHELATSFRDFFTEKVRLLVESTTLTSPRAFSTAQPVCRSSLTTFSDIGVDAVVKIIMESSSKSCSLDPIPTCLLNSCLSVLATTITHIVNLSLSNGHVPHPLKMCCT